MKAEKFFWLMGIMLFIACNKKDFLNVKPDNSLAVPTTLSDCQKLLDNDMMISNIGTVGWTVSDDYVIEEQFLPMMSITDRAQYSFASNPFPTGASSDWSNVYPTVFYANQVLAILDNYPEKSQDITLINKLRGSALFFRAYANFNLVTTFSKPFDPLTAASDPGIPLRKKADINEPVFRSSVAEVYSSIEADIMEAIQLLPETEAAPTRPTLPAAYAFLARYYLVTGDYEKANRYADSCLSHRRELMDYNQYTSIPKFNEEVLFHASLLDGFLNSYGSVHPDILASYSENDLRGSELNIYSLDGAKVFQGSYTGIYYRFGGLATDEVYLIRAETAARLGRWQAALADLNFLLEHRFVTGTFQPLTANNADEVLDLVILERRKELLFRGLRQLDLRRLNKEGRNIIVRRSLEGKQYELLPNSPLYTMPIPGQVIDLHPDMEQNPRQ